jgi:signal peptidase I
VKRVIGLPGDEIELINKQVFVNGKLNQAASFESAEFFHDFKGEKVQFFKEKSINGEYIIQISNQRTRADSVAKFKVPAGNYFVMGDNRDFSADSRYWGFVPKENIKGKAMFVWMSFTLPFSEEGLHLHLERIGRMI